MKRRISAITCPSRYPLYVTLFSQETTSTCRKTSSTVFSITTKFHRFPVTDRPSLLKSITSALISMAETFTALAPANTPGIIVTSGVTLIRKTTDGKKNTTSTLSTARSSCTVLVAQCFSTTVRKSIPRGAPHARAS